MNNSIVASKAFAFSLEIIKAYKSMKSENEFVISKQLLRSATSIGANIEEASAAISKKDFIAKMSISSKEARETHYWLRLIKESDIVRLDTIELLMNNCEELIKILTAIIKTSQRNSQN